LKRHSLVVLVLAFMTACTQADKQAEKPQPKPPEPAAGRYAFQQMIIAARGWARDAQPFQLESEATPAAKGQDGKSLIWRASFASPSQRIAKPYIWSGTDAQDAPARGVNPGPEDSYNPGNSFTQVFDIAFLKIDSDKALEVAQQHGGDKLLQSAQDTPVLFVLDWDRNSNQLIWHVIYGVSRDAAKLRVAVNATTGDFVRVEK